MTKNISLAGFILIRGKIISKTGLHIGAGTDTVEIGGIDSPVVKHPITGKPYIPGSSLKGKMRSFMEKISSINSKDNFFERNVGTKGNKIMQHVCPSADKAKKCAVCRVYGSTASKDGEGNYPARIIVRDCALVEEQEIMQENLVVFEAKMENAIDRITASAHPRTFERVPSGANFRFEIIYKIIDEFEKKNGNLTIEPKYFEYIKTDLKNIFEILYLIQNDGIGGNISRGYGQVEFQFPVDDEEVKSEIKYYPVGDDPIDIIPPNIEKTIAGIREYDFSNLESIILGGKN